MWFPENDAFPKWSFVGKDKEEHKWFCYLKPTKLLLSHFVKSTEKKYISKQCSSVKNKGLLKFA